MPPRTGPLGAAVVAGASVVAAGGAAVSAGGAAAVGSGLGRGLLLAAAGSEQCAATENRKGAARAQRPTEEPAPGDRALDQA